MRVTLATVSLIAVVVLCWTALFVQTAPAHAADCPNAGEVLITAATRETATKAGIPTSATCWKPTDANVGQDAGDAKKYLRSILCPSGAYGGAGPDGTINGLDANFAKCAAKFLKAAKDQGMDVCIGEGYRTVAQQEIYAARYRAGGGIACTKGAGCEHPRGIAIDVVSKSGYEKLWAMGPQYGVNFYLKGRDPVHFVPLNKSNTSDCAGGGQAITPDFPQYYNSTPSPVQDIRNAISPPPPPPPQPQQSAMPQPIAQPQTTPQPLPSQSQLPQTSPVSTGQPVLTDQTPVSSQINTQSGSSTAISNSNTNTNDTVETGVIGDASSAYTGIQEYAGDDLVSNSIDIGQAYEISLNGDTGDIATLDGEDASSTENGKIRYPDVAHIPVVPTSQTFVSPDLAYSPLYANTSSDNTFVQNALTILKNAVLLGLNYLKPFGGQLPQFAD